MFGVNSGSNNVFGKPCASTPVSTTSYGGSALTYNSKPVNNLFGNATNTASLSTPSPVGGLFGNNVNNQSTNNNNTTSLGNFGGMLHSNTSTIEKKTAGGLFSHNNVATNGNNPGIFTSTIGSNKNSFDSSRNNKTHQIPNGSSGLFSGLLNNNSTATGLFATNSRTTNMSDHKLQPTKINSNQIQQTNITSFQNPYGLQMTTTPITDMPQSITAAFKPDKLLKESLNIQKKRTLSASDSSLIMPPVQSSLINKLSSRLNSVRNSGSNQSRFFYSKNLLQQETIPNIPSTTSAHSLSTSASRGQTNKSDTLLKRCDLSEMRKLKIDTNRSAAKKLKLLNGDCSTTKLKLLHDDVLEPVKKRDHLMVTKITDEVTQCNDLKDEILTDLIEKTGYWCSPSIDQLLRLPVKQLSAIPNFMIGRRGYGTITFDYDVDLTEFIDDLSGNLFGKLIIFNDNKTVEVYPKDLLKPPVGFGLNVPATITLERVYPVDRKTKKLIIDNSKVIEVQYFVKKLRNMREMQFVSYNPFGGIWTFKVRHFSIWGLINDSDAEIDEEEINKMKTEEVEINRGAVSLPKQKTDFLCEREDISGSFDKQLYLMSNEGDPSNPTILEPLPTQENSIDSISQDDEASLLIQERQYEPDISEDDFEGLDMNVSLNISSDWLDQLKLASDGLKSIYNMTSSLVNRNVEDVIFSSFDHRLEAYNSAYKYCKINSSFLTVRFNINSSLLVKGLNTLSGVKEVKLKPTLHINKSSIDHIFDGLINNSIIGIRKSYKYPIVKQWSLSFQNISDAYANLDNESTIWTLSSILFDPISIQDSHILDSVKLILIKKKRHQNLSTWIVSSVSAEVDEKLSSAKGLEKVFLYLLKNDIISAAKSAIDSKNEHLSVLISLLGSNNPDVCEIAKLQLNKWKSLGHKVDSNIIKIYQLLSGFSDNIYGLGRIADEFSWLVSLGLQIIYGDIDSLSLEELIAKSLKNLPVGILNPKNNIILNILTFYSSNNKDATLIEKIKLNDNPFDVRLQWFFINTLQDLNFSDETRDYFNLQFIEQLKINQMYKEALFVSCMLKNDLTAKTQIDLLMSSQIIYFTNPLIVKTCDRLQIPKSIIYEYQALYDHYNQDYVSESKNLLKAGLYTSAERIIITKVAPKLILADNYNHLKLLSQLLEKFPHYETKSGSKGLSVFKLYLNFVLDGNQSKNLLEDLINQLPILHSTYSFHSVLLISCSLIAERICRTFLTKYKEAPQLPNIREKLLSLPLGEPERMYLKSVLSSV